jgi:hypothetical protein
MSSGGFKGFLACTAVEIALLMPINQLYGLVR